MSCTSFEENHIFFRAAKCHKRDACASKGDRLPWLASDTVIVKYTFFDGGLLFFVLILQPLVFSEIFEVGVVSLPC